MATPPSAVQAQLAGLSSAVGLELADAAAQVALEKQANAMLAATRLVVPAYYDAAGSLAVAWYDERRDEASPSSPYVATIIGDPTTDWIEREAEDLRRSLDSEDLADRMRQLTDEIVGLAEKEAARGFRDSILGNSRTDTESIGWSRVARGGACKFCVMLAGKGSVYRSESTAIFAAHKRCHCGAQPEFRNGDHGPEASVIQYVASSRRSRDDGVQAARNARVRAYLNKHFPDSPG